MDLNSIVVFHCDDKTSDNNGWQVLQFMASLHIGAELYYRPRDDEIMEFDVEDKYIKCMKRRINAKCRERDPEGSSGRSSPHSTCDKLVKEQDKRKFEFKWVYFKDLSQYLIPFSTMVGLIILFFIVGTIWDCCCQKEKNKFKDSGIISVCFILYRGREKALHSASLQTIAVGGGTTCYGIWYKW